MKNLLKGIKGLFVKALSSTPAKILKGAAYVATGLLVISGLMQTLTYAVTSFRNLAKAFAG